MYFCACNSHQELASCMKMDWGLWADWGLEMWFTYLQKCQETFMSLNLLCEPLYRMPVPRNFGWNQLFALSVCFASDTVVLFCAMTVEASSNQVETFLCEASLHRSGLFASHSLVLSIEFRPFKAVFFSIAVLIPFFLFSAIVSWNRLIKFHGGLYRFLSLLACVACWA